MQSTLRESEARVIMARIRNTNSSRALYGNREDRYLELVRLFPLRPLRTDSDLDAAIAVVDSLIDHENLSQPKQA